MNKAEKEIYDLLEQAKHIAFENDMEFIAVARFIEDGLLVSRNGAFDRLIGIMELCKYELLDMAKRGI
jgi:hypothetical protein